MCNRKTLYLAKETPNFMEIAEFILAIEKTRYLAKLSIDIVSIITGELFASRLSVGLWEVYV